MAFVWVGTGLGRERVGGKAQSDARCSVTRMVYGGPPPATGKYRIKVMQRDRCTVVDVAADQNLRIALMASNIDLYTLGGKLRNCGGNGACGMLLSSFCPTIDCRDHYEIFFPVRSDCVLNEIFFSCATKLT
mmetsp:Transcript_9854/g.20702  ORF Transcript_9854/g.20702 Transcript_9854/m.20702 type:complete len:132 (-) Transcript_9854:2180-2575(-)